MACQIESQNDRAAKCNTTVYSVAFGNGVILNFEKPYRRLGTLTEK